MLSKSAAAFLKKYPPFQFLDNQALMRLVQSFTIELYPAGAFILKQGTSSPRGLHVIKSGSVRIFAVSAEGEERLIEHRGVGETFGFLSFGHEELLDVSVQAVDETVCYVAESASVMNLLEDHPFLQEYLLPSYFPKRGDRPPRSPVAPHALRMETDRALFITPVKDLVGREIVTARADTSILEAARVMSAHRIGALVIVDAADQPVGIVTSEDLRDRVLVCTRDPAGPVGEIMSAPLVTVESTDFCFEAMLTMMSREVHHLPVLDAGRLRGMVTNHDFLVLQGSSPLIIIREIEAQATVEGFANAAGKVMGLIAHLLDRGAGASAIMRIISTVNDRIERKILNLAQKTLGPPPLPFCWIVYGSAGRREQTFRTDQDNAIIYDNPVEDRERLQAEEYFGRLAEFVVDAFLRCGFKLCPGDYMATNPLWRQPLATWKKQFSSWIADPRDRAIYHALNLFEFRGLHGEPRLAGELKKHLLHALRQQEGFLRVLADLVADYRPPIGVFGSLVFEKDGEHAKHLDIKSKCLTPLCNIVRLFSFECAIPEIGTLERIAALKNIHPAMKRIGDDLSHAFEFLSLLRIRHQLEQARLNAEPDNFLDPRRLSTLELRNIKEISKLISRVIDELARKYATGAQL